MVLVVKYLLSATHWGCKLLFTAPLEPKKGICSMWLLIDHKKMYYISIVFPLYLYKPTCFTLDTSNTSTLLDNYPWLIIALPITKAFISPVFSLIDAMLLSLDFHFSSNTDVEKCTTPFLSTFTCLPGIKALPMLTTTESNIFLLGMYKDTTQRPYFLLINASELRFSDILTYNRSELEEDATKSTSNDYYY